jgi:hypothetical protein
MVPEGRSVPRGALPEIARRLSVKNRDTDDRDELGFQSVFIRVRFHLYYRPRITAAT